MNPLFSPARKWGAKRDDGGPHFSACFTHAVTASVSFPLLSCKGDDCHRIVALFSLIVVLSHYLAAPLLRIALCVTRVPYQPPPPTGKSLLTVSQGAPQQSALCKGAFKGGCHGCQRRFVGHGDVQEIP